MVLLTNTDYSDFYASALITKEILESLGAEVDFQVSDWATVISRKEAANARDTVEEGDWHFYHTWGGPLDPHHRLCHRAKRGTAATITSA